MKDTEDNPLVAIVKPYSASVSLAIPTGIQSKTAKSITNNHCESIAKPHGASKSPAIITAIQTEKSKLISVDKISYQQAFESLNNNMNNSSTCVSRTIPVVQNELCQKSPVQTDNKPIYDDKIAIQKKYGRLSTEPLNARSLELKNLKERRTGLLHDLFDYELRTYHDASKLTIPERLEVLESVRKKYKRLLDSYPPVSVANSADVRVDMNTNQNVVPDNQCKAVATSEPSNVFFETTFSKNDSSPTQYLENITVSSNSDITTSPNTLNISQSFNDSQRFDESSANNEGIDVATHIESENFPLNSSSDVLNDQAVGCVFVTVPLSDNTVLANSKGAEDQVSMAINSGDTELCGGNEAVTSYDGNTSDSNKDRGQVILGSTTHSANNCLQNGADNVSGPLSNLSSYISEVPEVTDSDLPEIDTTKQSDTNQNNDDDDEPVWLKSEIIVPKMETCFSQPEVFYISSSDEEDIPDHPESQSSLVIDISSTDEILSDDECNSFLLNLVKKEIKHEKINTDNREPAYKSMSQHHSIIDDHIFVPDVGDMGDSKADSDYDRRTTNQDDRLLKSQYEMSGLNRINKISPIKTCDTKQHGQHPVYDDGSDNSDLVTSDVEYEDEFSRTSNLNFLYELTDDLQVNDKEPSTYPMSYTAKCTPSDRLDNDTEYNVPTPIDSDSDSYNVQTQEDNMMDVGASENSNSMSKTNLNIDEQVVSRSPIQKLTRLEHSSPHSKEDRLSTPIDSEDDAHNVLTQEDNIQELDGYVTDSEEEDNVYFANTQLDVIVKPKCKILEQKKCTLVEALPQPGFRKRRKKLKDLSPTSLKDKKSSPSEKNGKISEINSTKEVQKRKKSTVKPKCRRSSSDWSLVEAKRQLRERYEKVPATPSKVHSNSPGADLFLKHTYTL